MKPKRTTKKAAKKAAKKATRPAAKQATAKKAPELVPQPHGGALRTGGTPGNAGGHGRPPNAMRAVMRGNLEEVIPKLHERWRNNEIDALQYADYLAKYAIGPVKGVTDSEIDAFVKQVVEVVFLECGAELFERVSARLAVLEREAA